MRSFIYAENKAGGMGSGVSRANQMTPEQAAQFATQAENIGTNYDANYDARAQQPNMGANFPAQPDVGDPFHNAATRVVGSSGRGQQPYHSFLAYVYRAVVVCAVQTFIVLAPCWWTVTSDVDSHTTFIGPCSYVVMAFGGMHYGFAIGLFTMITTTIFALAGWCVSLGVAVVGLLKARQEIGRTDASFLSENRKGVIRAMMTSAVASLSATAIYSLTTGVFMPRVEVRQGSEEEEGEGWGEYDSEEPHYYSLQVFAGPIMCGIFGVMILDAGIKARQAAKSGGMAAGAPSAPYPGATMTPYPGATMAPYPGAMMTQYPGAPMAQSTEIPMAPFPGATMTQTTAAPPTGQLTSMAPYMGVPRALNQHYPIVQSPPAPIIDISTHTEIKSF